MSDFADENTDELFSEAIEDLQEKIDNELNQMKNEFPNAATIWDVESENTLGVVNSLRVASESEELLHHFYEAKKYYLLGVEAGAIDEEGDLSNRMGEYEQLIETMEEVNDTASALARTIPTLKDSVEELSEHEVDENE